MLSALLTGTALFLLTGLGDTSLALIGMKRHASWSAIHYYAQILAMIIMNNIADLQLEAGDGPVENKAETHNVETARFLELKQHIIRQTSPRIPKNC